MQGVFKCLEGYKEDSLVTILVGYFLFLRSLNPTRLQKILHGQRLLRQLSSLKGSAVGLFILPNDLR